jgi:hypothetical protein
VLESKLKERPAEPEATKSTYEMKKAAREAAGGKAPAPAQAEPRRYDVFMKLTGVAQTDAQVAQYINRLSRSKLLKDVNLVSSEMMNLKDEALRKFQIELSLNPEADVQAIQDRENQAAASTEAKE